MERIYHLEGIDCANCAAKLERAIGKLKNVHSASLTFLTGRLVVDCAEDAEADILAVIKKREPEVVVTKL